MGHHNITLGRAGEALVVAHYRSLGYEVLAQNWRAGRTGELDLVCARDGVVVVCEVKTRSNGRFGSPLEAVDARKQRRLRTLAVQFLAAHDLRARSIRFDVAAVLAGELQLVEGAF